MNVRLFIFCVLFSTLFCNKIFAQYEFIENKGQWIENIKYKVDLKYGAIFFENNCITYNFLEPLEHSHSAIDQYAIRNPSHTHNSETRKGHAYKVHFLECNIPVFSQYDNTSDYCNYFIGNNPSKWAAHVKKYRKIKYENLYDGIDLVYYTTKSGLKYDFVLNPGADVNKIQFEYEGVDNLSLKKGNLIIPTSLKNVIEVKPYAYQIINSDTVEIACSYVLKKNKLSFKISEQIDKTKELIIDPYLVFSTYSGSSADNWGFTATWDYDDNVYSGGIVFGTGYPVSLGAYQFNYAGGTPPVPGSQGGCDIAIIKYNSDGTQRLYATYLGGATGQEMPHSLVVTEENDLVIMGTTGANDFPTTSNAFSKTFSGGDSLLYDGAISFPNGTDIFITKLSKDGTNLLGSTYIGGSANDGLNFKRYYTYPNPVTFINYVEQHGNDSLYYNYGDGARGEVIVDKSNMIYVGTNTFSGDFPAGTKSGFQTSGGGGQDGVVFKLSPDLSELLWSTYLGGDQDDAIFGLTLDNNEDVLVAGGTVSHNFPVTQGAYNPVFNGGTTDAFVTKLNSDGDKLLASTYFGSNKYDNAYFVGTDRFNNIFIYGQTKASGNTLIKDAGYSVPNSGQFVAKLSPDLKSLVWSTVFGSGNGRPNISPTAFAVDVCNRVYASGWGREWVGSYYNAQGDYYNWSSDFGTKKMPVTTDAFQSNTDGQDFYIIVLDENADDLEYATFFGELHNNNCPQSGRDHVDGGTARFDKKGHIIQSVCASCLSGACQSFPTTEGAWSRTNEAYNCNDAVFKFRIIEKLAEANFDPVPAGCIPYTINFKNNSQGTDFLWDFGDGTTSTDENPVHIYPSIGEYTVKLIANFPYSCNIADTMTRVVKIFEPQISILPDATICKGESIVIGPSDEYSPETTFFWMGATDLDDVTTKNPKASPVKTTEYTLIATGVCPDTIHQKVVVLDPQINIIKSNDTIICSGGVAQLSAFSAESISLWEWSDKSDFSNIISNNQTINVFPSVSTIYYVRATESDCQTQKTEQITVEIYEFDYSLIPQYIICYGETTNLTITNNDVSTNLSYSWTPLTDIISGADSNSPLVKPLSPTTFTATITNTMGCQVVEQIFVDIDRVTFDQHGISDNLCYGECKGSITVHPDGISPYSYLWSNGETTQTITNLCAGLYSVTATDSNGCTAKTDITITSPSEIKGTFTNVTSPKCDGIGYGSATINPTGGTPAYSYIWSPGGSNQAVNNQCVIGINTVTVTDSNNCKSVFDIDMPSPSTLISRIDSYNMISCNGYCDGSITVEAEFGTLPYKFSWSNGVSGKTISGICAGEYIATVVDDQNCVSHQYFEITEPEILSAATNVISPILCYGESGSVNVEGKGGTSPYSYVWNNGTIGNSLNNIIAGSYFVTVTDSNNCKNILSVNLEQPDELSLNGIVINMLCDDVCNGEIISEVKGGTPSYTYNWSNGSKNTRISNLCEGNYKLIIKDKNNCSAERDFIVYNDGFVPDLEVNASSLVIYKGQSVALSAQSSKNGSYFWDNRQLLNSWQIPNPTAKPEEETLFTVKFVDEHGCVSYDTIRIKVNEVICKDPYIFVPNAFTPNDDAKNDYFKPYYPDLLIESIYFAVYDRWGAILYESDKVYDKGWDGTYKGEKLTSDVYVFWLKVKCVNGENYEHKGNVTLLR